MPKDIQQLGQEYDATTKKLMDGREHIIDLFTVGLTFPDPRQGGNEITFNTAEDGTNYLAKLNKSTDPALPLAESGRKGNEHVGMKLFLYSKGFTPEDIEELMMNPASDKILIICDVLEVSPYELLGAAQSGKYEIPDHVIVQKDTEEYLLIERYRKLKKDQRERLLGYMEALRNL